MPESAERSVVSVWRRIGLWFVCLLLGVALFSLLFSLWLTMAGSAKLGLAVPVFRVTMKCALPVWILWLPMVMATKEAEGGKIWTLLAGGSLIGPLAMGLWFLVLQIGGAHQQPMWQGDPLIGWVGSAMAGMIFALIVGVLTSSLYVAAFRVLHRRSVRRSMRQSGAASRRSAQI